MSPEDRQIRKAAYSAVNAALRSGLVVRNSCVKCGEGRAEAHHEDYRKPIDVTWLCRKCHAARHREINSVGKAPKTKMPSNRVVFTDAQTAQIISSYAEGKPAVWIAARMKCSETSIRMALAKAWVQARPPGPARKAV